MHNLGKIIKVTAAVLEDNGMILIAQRKSGDYLSSMWEFPGGKIEVGETPEQCLRRELKEEFNIDVSVGEYYCSNTHHYAHVSIELMFYRAYWLDGAITMNDHDGYRWVRVEQLTGFNFAPADRPFVEMLCAGTIKI